MATKLSKLHELHVAYVTNIDFCAGIINVSQFTNSVCEQGMLGFTHTREYFLSHKRMFSSPNRWECFLTEENVFSQKRMFSLTKENVFPHKRECFLSPQRRQCLPNFACFLLVHLQPQYADKQKPSIQLKLFIGTNFGPNGFDTIIKSPFKPFKTLG